MLGIKLFAPGGELGVRRLVQDFQRFGYERG